MVTFVLWYVGHGGIARLLPCSLACMGIAPPMDGGKATDAEVAQLSIQPLCSYEISCCAKQPYKSSLCWSHLLGSREIT